MRRFQTYLLGFCPLSIAILIYLPLKNAAELRKQTELGLVSEINEAPITSNYGNESTCYSRQHRAESTQLIGEQRKGPERLWDWLNIKIYHLAEVRFSLCVTSGQIYAYVFFSGAKKNKQTLPLVIYSIARFRRLVFDRVRTESIWQCIKSAVQTEDCEILFLVSYIRSVFS